MSDFTVHGIPGSPYVRSPLLALAEKGLEWRLAAIPFGGHRTPEFARLQPFQKIPAFTHQDFHLYETQAILRYIDRIAPSPALTPSDVREAARMDQLLNIVDSYVASRVSAPVTFPRLVAPRFGMPVEEAAIAAAMPDAAHVVGEIARLMDDAPYLTGDTLSLADIHLIPHLSLLPDFAEGRTLLGGHANLQGWIARMNARPSMAATSWEALAETAGSPLPAIA